jgi:putative inorganic carbon (HCO3(-)) transporter
MQGTKMLKIFRSEHFVLLVLVLLSAALGAAPTLLSPLLASAILLLLGLAIAFFCLGPLGVSGLLLLATVVNRYHYELGTRSIKAEHVIVAALWALLLLRLSLKRESKFFLPLSALFALGWLGTNLLSSYVSPAPSATAMNDLIRLILMIAIFLILPNLIRTEEHVTQAFGLFLVLGVLESVFGMFALALYYIAGVNLGVGYPASYPGPAPTGTLSAANIFGSYTMSVSLVFLVLLLAPPTQRTFSRRWILTGFLITFAAVILSLTRGAWLGFVAMAVFFLIVHRGFHRFSPKSMFLLAIIVGVAIVSVAAIIYLLPNDIALIERLASFTRLGSERTVVGRMAKYDVALSAWQERPLLGWGTGGMARVFGREQRVLAWVGNLEIHVLIDAGLMGLVFFASFIAALLLGAVSALRKARGSRFETMLLSLLIGYAGVLLAYQSTAGIWLGLFWAHAGLIAAATHVINMRVQSRELRPMGAKMSSTPC